MNCIECRDLLVEYVLGELPPEVVLRIDAHLAEPCAGCRREFSEMNELLHSLGGSIPSIDPPPRVKAELLSRIRDDSQARTLPIESAPARWRQVLPYAATILISAFLGSIAAKYWKSDQVAQADRREYDRRLDNSHRLFPATLVRLATFHALQPMAASADPPAYIVGDQLAGQWHIYAFDLTPPAPGHQLQLWFFTSGNDWIKADPLRVQDDGVGTALFDVPTGVQIVRAVITDEPDSDADEPQGEMLLAAELPAVQE